ncbi:MAG: 2-oxo acid dehydrogenase subunit E2, partial [Deltaproteobacteria bacterium]|nr:2-oxo acid dehydrogenase subunit E2 [Deltaproteobacteria bacterium]
GEKIAKDQGIIELETEKAVVEVPSPEAGKVSKIFVKEGAKAKVGEKILSLEMEEKSEKIEEKREEKKEVKREDKREETKAETKEIKKEEVIPAGPLVRRLAREMEVDLSQVRGSGSGGRITPEDVKQSIQKSTAVGGAVHEPPLPDFAKWGKIERQPMSSIRAATARNVSLAWSQIPHVTQNDTADITGLMELRKRFSKKVEAVGGKLTITAMLLKIVGSALKTFPQFNASIDPAKEEIILKKYCHVGVAVDTERGLVVPVVRDADKKNILSLAKELAQLSEKARTKKLSLEEMQGGTFTITNLGSIGGGHFSPIVRWPEVAILGVGKGEISPVFENSQWSPKNLLPLSLSYDHRIIDGADAARFLRWIANSLQEPFLADLEG